MLEYAQAGDGVPLAVLVLHDDDKREYANGPAALPDTKIGAFPQDSMTRRNDEAKQKAGTIQHEE